MKLMKSYWYILSLAFLMLMGTIVFLVKPNEIVLTVGIFSGSNWEVPDADSYEQLDQAIAIFEASHPDVKVIYESGIRKDQYEEWLAQAILLDELPDLFFIPSELFTTFAKNGTLENLQAHIQMDPTFDTSVYYETSLQEGMLQNQLYALPYESVPEMMFVNKTLLEREGIPIPDESWTWDDFYDIARRVSKDTDQDGAIDQFGVYGYTWQQAAYSNGAYLYQESSQQVSLVDERVVEAIAFLRKLNSIHDEKVSLEMFDQGQVAFCPMNYSTYRTYMPYPWRVKKFSSFAWDSISLPKGPNGTNSSLINTLMIGMSSRSANKDLAWEFMKLLSCDETIQINLAKTSQGVSVLPAVMTSPEVIIMLNQDHPGTSTFEINVLDTVMKQGISIRNTEEYEQLMQTADAVINELLQNDQDIENALIRLQQQLNAMLSK